MADSRYFVNPWLTDFTKDSEAQVNPNEVSGRFINCMLILNDRF